MQTGSVVFVNRVDGHNTCVLQLSERLGLVTFDRRDLQDHMAACKISLFGQPDGGERSTPQGRFQPKTKNLNARAG